MAVMQPEVNNRSNNFPPNPALGTAVRFIQKFPLRLNSFQKRVDMKIHQVNRDRERIPSGTESETKVAIRLNNRRVAKEKTRARNLMSEYRQLADMIQASRYWLDQLN